MIGRATLGVLLAGLCWLALMAVALSTGSALDEVVALLAGLALIAAAGWVLLLAARQRRVWQQAIDAMQAGIVLYDRDDRLLMANADFRRLYDVAGAPITEGMSFEQLLQGRVRAGLVPEALQREQAWIAERLAEHRERGTRSFLRRMVDGRWRRITEQSLADGGRLGFSIDVTELVEQQHALDAARAEADASRATLSDAIEALPDGFALYDAEDRLVLCNQRYRDIYRDSAPAMVLGASFEQIVRYGLERGQYPQAAGDPEAWLAERVQRHREPDGVPILQQLQGDHWLRIDERRTRSGGVAGVRTDVTELVRTRQQLERLSSTDGLTGLANRRRFDAALAEEVQRAHRHGTPLALLLIDVDHFKLYNDRHGHPAGDGALQAVAGVLAQQARRPGEMVARYGGEEFALLLPHAGRETALAVAERCLAAIAALAWPHGASPTAAHLTLSIGIALLHMPRREAAALLLRRADAALYRAKAEGRNRFANADEETR